MTTNDVIKEAYSPGDFLQHYGTPRHSGRYPWGSGDNPFQRGGGDFLNRVQDLRKEGLSEKEIANYFGLSTTQLRAYKAQVRHERKLYLAPQARAMDEAGIPRSEIAKKLGLAGESSVRALLAEGSTKNASKGIQAADFLEEQIKKKGIIDVGKGVEHELGISSTKMQEVITILEKRGYTKQNIDISQATNPNQKTKLLLICPPGTTKSEAIQAKLNGEIYPVADLYHSPDGGKTFDALKPPVNLDSKRIKIRYAEDGGSDKDGVIELRRGVEDISLGNSHYAQVRIAVDGTHYIKGMAMYGENMPKGVDVIFNTNKHKGTPMKGNKDNSVLKNMKTDDPDNPFGALIKANGQRWYIDKDGKRKQSVINKVREEGDWNKWSDTLSSQFLSKQSQKLIKRQLDITHKGHLEEFAEIKSLTNPVLRKHLLLKFADDCDSAAIHMKAAALPRQKNQVILPITSMKDTEVYAPNYRNGEKVALVRYPHAGTFEIPVLTVNNRQKDARRILGPNVLDAVGISSKVASRLSGADFDGDSVVVIPCGKKVNITSRPPLRGLKGFDPVEAYPPTKNSKRMTQTNREMGIISNLITDMTLQGATDSELTRAVRHSMVVIDAEKHGLDYKRSEIDNDIRGLKRKYQMRVMPDGSEKFGAATLLSKRKQTAVVPKRTGTPRINPKTGEYIYKEANESYLNAKGERVKRTTKVPLLSTVRDANDISLGTTQEKAYATYSNQMRAMANEARKTAVAVSYPKYDRGKGKLYSNEVHSLNKKLMQAEKHAPAERRAQILANSAIRSKMNSLGNDISKSDRKDIRKKIASQEIAKARSAVGIKKGERIIDISDGEWKAIQEGAISPTKFEKILLYADQDQLRKRATPRSDTTLNSAKVAKIKAMHSTYTIREIADSLGVSTSTVSKYLQEN